MDVKKTNITEEQKKIKYAVEFHTGIKKYILKRADFGYNRAGKTFQDISKAIDYRDKENYRIDKELNL